MVLFFRSQNQKLTKTFAVNNSTCACSFQFKFINIILEKEDLVLKSSKINLFKIYELNIDKII